MDHLGGREGFPWWMALAEAVRLTGEGCDVRPLVGMLEEVAQQLVPCEDTFTLYYDSARDEFRGRLKQRLGQVELRVSGSQLQQLLEEGRAIYRNAPPFPGLPNGVAIRDLMLVPLTTPGGLVGALGLINLDRASTPGDMRMGECLGTLAGIAIRRELEQRERQKLEDEMELARELISRLLPRGPTEKRGYRLHSLFLPAGRTGGDLFDYRFVGDNLTFMIADACGHGLAPCLVATQCRAYLRALLPQGSLGVTARTVHALLMEDLADDQFVTCCFGRVNTLTHRLSYVSAGHGWVYHIREGHVRALGPTCPPLGAAISPVPGTPRVLRLAPGDVFLLLTDGFAEWADSAGELFGQDRLEKVLEERPLQVLTALHEAVKAFGHGRPQQDDVTALAISRERVPS